MQLTGDKSKQCLPGARKVAGAARDERDGERLAEDRQASALPEAVDEGRHPLVVAQGAPQVPASAQTQLLF